MSKIGDLRDCLVALLQEHEHDGALPTSARFLFYELVQREVLSKEKTGARRPDQDMSDALMDIREDGRVPWHWIVDETRSVESYAGAPTVKQGVLRNLADTYLNPWNEYVPLILTESRSLAGALRGLAADYRCRIASTNGQCGGFLRTDIVPMLFEGASVIYLGDWDLAGNQIETNTRAVLEREAGALNWMRLALTEQQVADYALPVITKRDGRYKDKRPHQAVETEALRQSVLTDILRNYLETIIPEPLADVQEREAAQREKIRRRLGR